MSTFDGGSIFDLAAPAYDAVRPSYPPALVDDVIALSRLPRDGRILEVGCGTGQATRLFCARRCRITAVEAGVEMAARARANLPDLDVRVGRFEALPLGRDYALIVSATAWHWMDPQVRYQRARELLLPGGALALFWNEHVRGADDVGFFDATQDLYARAGMDRHRLQPDAALVDRSPAIVASGAFGEVERRQYPWHAEYDAATYARLIGTYSDHLLLPDDIRRQLLDGIAALIDTRFCGRIVKHYVADLYVARVI